MGFNNSELLVSASTAVLADGTSLPADVSNGTFLAGYPVADLKTAVETAGDVNQMQARVDLVGTQFGVGPPNVPLPPNITLANDGYLCPNPTTQGTKLVLLNSGSFIFLNINLFFSMFLSKRLNFKPRMNLFHV